MFSFDTACKAECARLGLHLAAKRGYCATVSRGNSLLPDYGVISSRRLPVFPLPGSHVHVQAQHVVRGSGSGEGGDRDVLPGSHPLPVLLLALPHSLLPL